MDIHDELGLVYRHIRKALSRRQFFRRNSILPHHTACFPHAQRSAAGNAPAFFIPGQILPKEMHQYVDLAAQLQLRGIKRTHTSSVYTVALCRVHLPLSGMRGTVQPHSRQLLRQQPLPRAARTVIKKPLTVQLHIVYVANTCHSPALVHTIQCKFQRHRLHQSIGAPLFHRSARKPGHVSIPGGVYHDFPLHGAQPFLGCHQQPFQRGASHKRVHDGRLQKYIKILT